MPCRRVRRRDTINRMSEGILADENSARATRHVQGLTRRQLIATSFLAASAFCVPAAANSPDDAMRRALVALERKHGGRLGVAIYDGASRRVVAHRGDERFPMCSTSKFLSSAFLLSSVDGGQEYLGRRIVFRSRWLVPHSPELQQYNDGARLSIRQICGAAMIQSDNTAANLMLDSFGGPAKLTAFLRSIGDPVTRLDRREPDLNESRPGDPRDTTTPLAMLQDMRRFLLGTGLTVASREQLIAWLVANQTGGTRLRAGAPTDWRIGDKTGTGDHGVANDIAILWPPRQAPILIAAYYAESNASAEERDAVLAEVGRLAASTGNQLHGSA